MTDHSDSSSLPLLDNISSVLPSPTPQTTASTPTTLSPPRSSPLSTPPPHPSTDFRPRYSPPRRASPPTFFNPPPNLGNFSPQTYPAAPPSSPSSVHLYPVQPTVGNLPTTSLHSHHFLPSSLTAFSSSSSTPSTLISRIEKFFGLSNRNTTFQQELHVGIFLFLTSAYILPLNPSLFSLTDLQPSGVAFATAITSGISTILLSLWANLPFCLAPGMGLNAFFVYELVMKDSFSAQQALALSFIAGVVVAIMGALNVAAKFSEQIPLSLRKSVAVGIGLFQTIIGLYCMGLIRPGHWTLMQPAEMTHASQWVAVLGLLLVGILVLLEIPGAVFFGIFLPYLMSIAAGVVPAPERYTIFSGITSSTSSPVDIPYSSPFTLPPSSSHHKRSAGTAPPAPPLHSSSFSFPPGMDFSIFGPSPSPSERTLPTAPISPLLPLLLLILLSVLDAGGALVGLSKQAPELENHRTGGCIGGRKAVVVVGIGTMLSAIMGTAPVTILLESSAAVGQGGRSGLSGCICGLLFLVTSLFAPSLSSFPLFLTASVLVFVGSFLMSAVLNISWDRIDCSLPAFLVICICAFAVSVQAGVVVGFIFYAILQIPFVVARVGRGQKGAERNRVVWWGVTGGGGQCRRNKCCCCW
eukprot:GHVS01091812.1.p1 GENE.GHVS01091812.1~~GHVS01091812.1.p1  ORF type:complete len:638 (-),score=130.05 GHVS01091812.1:1257-3170(-)